MNEAFAQLPPEKQAAINNAAMEVFGQYDYKRASTDLIAAKAGVSKGLLFYYFHNKKALYLHIYTYASRRIAEAITDAHLWEITDFFDFITYATEKKVKLLAENPHLLQFSLRCFYSQQEEVSGDVQNRISTGLQNNYAAYFRNLDFGKFRESADPEYIFHMLVWMTDGYLHARQMEGKPIVLEEIDREFARWIQMFKRIAYKEEYLCV